MPKRVEFNGVIHEFPDDFSDEEIGAALAMQPSHEKTQRPAPFVNVGGRGTGLDVRQSQSRMTAALPTLGAMGGAALGGLTSPVTGPVGPAMGAAIGGGAGEALRAKATGRDVNAGDVVTQGLLQGSMQAAGPVVNALGSGLYKGGVALLPKGIKIESPDLATAGYREGIALTKGGANKAGKAITESARQADAAIAAAERGGAGPVSTRAVISELRPARDKAARAASLGMPDETGAIAGRAKAFAAHNKGGIPLTRAQELKREAQDLATAAYKAHDRGAPINTLETLMNEAQARGLRQEIERLVPGVGDINARTQSLIGLEKAAEHAGQTGHVLSRLGGSTVGAGVAGIPGAIGGMALTTPGGLTTSGLALKSLVPAVSHLPTAVRAAILAQLLAGEQQDQ